MVDFLSVTVNGLMVAGLYAAMSFGLALVYGVMKIINLAHAGLIMLGALLSYSLWTAFGLDPFFSWMIIVPLFFLLGMGLYGLLVRRLPEGGNAPAIQSLLLLFGVWLVLQNVGYYVWGGETRSILTSYTMLPVHIGPVTVGMPSLLVFLVSAAVLFTLHMLLSRTYTGRAIRAVAQNRAAAELVGINAIRVATIAFGLGTGLAGLSGSLVSSLYAFSPDFGRNLLLKAFCIIVLGGMESFAGVALGAVVVALAEAYAARYLVSNVYQDALTFGLLVLALIVLPQGLPGLGDRVGRLMRRGEVARR